MSTKLAVVTQCSKPLPHFCGWQVMLPDLSTQPTPGSDIWGV